MLKLNNPPAADKNMPETYIKGHQVAYEENASQGAYYLEHHLNQQEATAMFTEARMRGRYPFEDAQRRHYVLSHNSDGTYTIIHKQY